MSDQQKTMYMVVYYLTTTNRPRWLPTDYLFSTFADAQAYCYESDARWPDLTHVVATVTFPEVP